MTALRFAPTRSMTFRTALLVACLGGALGTGCGPAEPEYQYGVEEVRQAVVGKWTGTLSLTGRAETGLTLTLDYAPPAARPTCGNRTLSLHTNCIDVSTMGLTGTFTTADGTYAAKPVTGDIMIDGTQLTYGQLTLRTADGLVLTASFDHGKFLNGSVQRTDSLGSFTIARAP